MSKNAQQLLMVRGAEAKGIETSTNAASFTEHERTLGEEISRKMPSTVAQILLVGKKLSEAHASMLHTGRDSLWGRYCETFLPAIERRTIDRWRRSYEKFATLVELESGQVCPSLMNLRMTAVYRLTKEDASDADRTAALAVAKSGKLVTEKLAAQIICGGDLPKKDTRPKKYRTKLELPSGTIVVTINHTDFREALEEALREVQEQAHRIERAHDVHTNGP